MLSLSDVADYLRSLRDRIATVQEDCSASDKFLLASNVFEQIKDHAPSLATHQVLSKYLEKLVTLLAHSLIEDPKSDIQEKRNLCLSICNQIFLKADVEVLSKDMFGSHVLQSTLQCCTLFEHQGISLSEPLQYVTSTVEDRCLFELLHHTSGSHVLRSLTKTLAGALDSDAFQKSKQISENSFGNYVIQALVRHRYFQATHMEELLDCIDISELLLSSSSPIVWRLCESAVTLGTGQSHFIKKLLEALGISQNRRADPKSQSPGAKRRKTEVGSQSHDTPSPEHTDSGDANATSDAGATSVARRGVECGKGRIWLALISCKPVDSDHIHLRATGASILLNLLKFERKLIAHVLSDFKHFLRIAKSQNKLGELATDRHFSRVLQLLLDRRQGLMKEKQIERLFNYLKADFVELALNVNGAFVLSSLFAACPLRLRQSILTELAPESDRILAKSKKFAEIVGLESFCKNKELWSKKMSKAESVRSLFKDIIEPK
ncbi:uncharacterized protein BXIN_0401 [Babesia sp. Xinjiang]|uniref:uncharacterized protein n=1 Tax=Babesia sp. Xinjiang TaxID=462227 RepID=UPI000A23C521|nr:uncharacterized protein BXIN_0401 [Babesia sp. Xinjiang]ORM41063.1 hypothetical protein BXIN_0401 [Babesia sp. Xinjiang]